MSGTARERDPLEPIGTALRIVGTLLLLLLGLSLLVPQQSWGNGPVCASAPADQLPPARSQSLRVALEGLLPGSRTDLADVNVCAPHPDAVTRIAGLLSSWPSMLLLVGAVLLGRRLLAEAGRPGGLYAPDTARRVGGLGRYLVAGALVAGVVESAARTAVLVRQFRAPVLGWFQPDEWHVSLSTLLIGLVMITLAWVMRVGVTMREELDVTI